MVEDKSGLDRGNRVPKYEARRMEILHAAAKVFYSKGFHGSSMRDIAGELKVKQASLYHYFNSKTAILEAICRLGVTEFIENLREVTEGNLSTAEKIDIAIYRHLEPVLSHRFYVQAFIFMRRDLPKEARNPLDRIAHEYEQLWKELLKSGQDRGEVVDGIDLDICVFGILGMLNSVARWSHSRQHADLNEISKSFARIISSGLCR